MINAESIWQDVVNIREQAPLIHNITNYVVMNSTANALLALGASPVMAHAVEEVTEMVAIAGALVINIGTLSAGWIASMHKAAAEAKARNVPLILDPVGSGATALRTKTAKQLIAQSPPDIIRGNGSEIISLLDAGSMTKGVDSVHGAEAAQTAAKKLVDKYNCTVSISGQVDIIISINGQTKIRNGHPMMPKVTGLGCTASALTGAFAAVNRNYQTAAAHAMAVLGIAGEIAAEKSAGPGSLQLKIIDCLYGLDQEMIKRHLQVED